MNASYWGAQAVGTSGKLAGMPKAMKTRSELENLVLTELRQTRFCAEARSVTVIRLEDEGFDANWAVNDFDPGQADVRRCEDALNFIVPRLQNQLDLREG
jgi:hypothetical protein